MHSANPHRLLIALACAAALGPAAAAEVVISNVQPLAFGSFTAGPGSVTVGADGARVTSGNVVVLGTDPGQAAQFVVTGDANTSFAVTLPADGVVTLGNGSLNMPVNAFTSSPASTGVLSGGGSLTLNVGATLEVAAGQSAGGYSGSFTVVVNYN
ncbi:DUF4402 domain-containing protein [Lysobacter sp. D1-1-M9]|uniref:DUF4402 domain-containing protein n=1 Tax=Novilysobacter longmucuonensis TaxID=3098603 RepID=UPI002FC782CE